MKFAVVVNKTEYGFDAHCPALKGCHSQGDTLEEALDNIRDAIEQYMEALKDLNRDRTVYEVEVAV